MIKYRTNSWHAKAYRWTEEKDSNPSFCSYWGTILVQIPLVCAIFTLFLPVLPFIWLGEKLDAKLKGKALCPFGRVQIEDAQNEDKT